MKKLIAGICMVASMAASAEAIFLADNADQTKQWWGYAETFTDLSDGYSILVGIRYPNTNKHEDRLYYAITSADCNKGFGSLLSRESTNSNWHLASNVSIKDPVTVADVIAQEICSVRTPKKLDTSKPKAKSSGTAM